MTDQDLRTCPTCHSDEEVKVMHPVRDGMMFKCLGCKKIWTVLFARESRPMFPPEPRL